MIDETANGSSFAGSSTQLAPMWSQCRMGSTQLEAPLDGKEVARNHAQVIAFNEAGAARKIASGRSIALSVLFFSQLS